MIKVNTQYFQEQSIQDIVLDCQVQLKMYFILIIQQLTVLLFWVFFLLCRIFQHPYQTLIISSIQQHKQMIADPFNYPFPNRADTMTLSTINQRDFSAQKKFIRESTFQKTDIIGSSPTKFIPLSVNKQDFTLSTFVQTGIQNKKINKISDSMKIDDIEGTQSCNKGFKTGRVTNPLFPIYKLPSHGQMTMDKGRNFIRDTLKTDDITGKKERYLRQRGIDILSEVVPGSKPKNLTHNLNSTSSLRVQDINKQGVFESRRVTNPLSPIYKWRDNFTGFVNSDYGKIDRSQTQQKHPKNRNKQEYFGLQTNDIEGAHHNSYFQRNYFLNRRRDIRDYMKTNDIQNCQSSSLKKGISTQRVTNPLVPNYKLPGHSQNSK